MLKMLDFIAAPIKKLTFNSAKLRAALRRANRVGVVGVILEFREIKVYSASDFPSYLPKLNSLFDDLFADGKYFRSQLVGRIGKQLGIDSSGLQLLGQTIEFIHNASLLHDDLVDRSHLRRNKTTAWLKYTPEYAVLAGDYLLARVMVNLSTHGNMELVKYTSEMISDLLEGEWIQDSLVRDWDIEMSQLDRVHDLKTASLFKWCLKAPFLYARNFEPDLHRRLTEMGRLLGVLFQRGDDLLDFDVRNEEGKAILGDLKSGYLNSFGVFLSEPLAENIKKNFIQSQSMADVLNAMGADYFNARLAEFDVENKQLIGLYQQLVRGVRDQLSEQQKPLCDDLMKLCDLLYWRKKS